jgi:ribonucleoside-diphosphate reductase alpha chain
MNIEIQPRPPVLPSSTIRLETDYCGKIYMHCTYNDQRLFEVFVNLGKAGACQQCLLRGIGILISMLLRAGIQPEKIADNLSTLNCGMPTVRDGKTYNSCLALIASQLPLEGREAPAGRPQRIAGDDERGER